MKKVIYFGTIVISMFMFIGGVNAANYSEGNWVQTSDNCGDYSEGVTKSYTAYTFDSANGIFSLSGLSYSESMSGNGERNYVFYAVSEDQKTLYAYIPSYNNNSSFIDSSLGIPVGSCNDIYRVTKEVVSNSGDSTANDTTDNDNVGNQITDSTDQEYVDYEDEPSDFFPSVGDGEDYDSQASVGNTNNVDDVKTESNPNTGLVDYILYIVPLFLIGGVVLVLKKNKILGL